MKPIMPKTLRRRQLRFLQGLKDALASAKEAEQRLLMEELQANGPDPEPIDWFASPELKKLREKVARLQQEVSRAEAVVRPGPNAHVREP